MKAFDDSLEKDLLNSLAQSMDIIENIVKKLAQGAVVASELAQLKATAENIRITDLLLEERFKLREEKAKTLGSKAVERHEAMAEGYRKALTEYLSLIDNLPSDGTIPQSAIRNLQSLLEKILPKKRHPIIGSLPYKHLNYPAQEPTTASAITPAYKGGDKTVLPDDTKSTPEAPISKDIATLAQSLGWNPVSIYEYVKNTIETEWYRGCMKGAEETLRQKSGNDCDQATLLTALLRASGFPTRYVRGVIEFFPDIEKAKNLTGIDDPQKIAEFYQKAGIPFKPIIAGGKIANFQIEHVWVESQIPYANYRGAIIDEHGKTWLGLDTSIKVKDYVYNNPKDIFQESEVSSLLPGIRDEYLSAVQTLTPLEFLQAKLSAMSYELTDYVRTRTLPEEHLKILPASLQFEQVKVTNEYTQIPDELIHKVRFKASRQYAVDSIQGNLFDITLPLYRLSNQLIAVSYEPETVEDQEIINSYGGLDNTPAYLLRLRPVLIVNKERIVVATDGLPMGADYTLAMELYSPSVNEGATPAETTTNTMMAGNLSVIGIVAQKAAATPSPLAGEGGGEGAKDAERLLYVSAQHYIDRWNQAEDELASLFHLSIARPLSTVVTVGGVIDVTYLLDMPQGFTWKGVYVDADHRSIETATRTQSTDDRQKLFMQLSSLQGSILENKIFEDDFQVESISTAKLFQLVTTQPANPQLVTIDKSNIDAVLPTLSVDDNIKEDIINSVNQNIAIRIPQSEIVYHDWSGTGYIKENPETGESGWMLSGMIAGGMSAEKPEAWLNQHYADTLSAPYTGPTNTDPMTAVRIQKIPSTDNQPGCIVGKPLPQPLAVYVSDSKANPVKNATVTFRIIAGGGKFDVNGQPSDEITVTTANTGIAKTQLTLGTKTGDNPHYMMLNATDTYYTQVGANLVTAKVTSYSGDIHLNQPFEQYAAPDIAGQDKEIRPVRPAPEETVKAVPNTPVGTLKVTLDDQYGNPISNVMLTFAAQQPASSDPAYPLPTSGVKNLKLYTSETTTNPYPLYDDIPASSQTVTAVTQYYGAQIESIAGNTYNTKYTVIVTAALQGVAPASLSLYTLGTRGEDVSYYFSPYTWLGYMDLVNDKGQLVNAAKISTELKAPLVSTLFVNEDKIDTDATFNNTDNPPFNCTLAGQQTKCRYVKSKGIVEARKIPTGTVTYMPALRQVIDGKVTYTASSEAGTVTPTQNLGNGNYQTRYTASAAPRKNYIEAWGDAEITVPEIFYKVVNNEYRAYIKDNGTNTIPQRPITLRSGQYVEFDPATLESKFTADLNIPFYGSPYIVYSVDTQLTIEPSVVLLSDKGYTTTDINLKYKILPYTLLPDGSVDQENTYHAIGATMDIWKADLQNTETWDSWTPGDKTEGEGIVTFVKGWTFDINNLYKAEVVLNRGTDVEVRSQKKEIPLAQIVVTPKQSLETVDEIKFGDGSKPGKKYSMEFRSRALLKDCVSLTGKITIVNDNGQAITVPGAQDEYYLSEYPLAFPEAFFGGCKVRVKDMTDNGNEDQYFVVSNKSRAGLDMWPFNPDLIDTTVLYGGIGNTFKIEVNGAKKYLPIEPVGVVVLGIDGLRQDVLYESSQVNDPIGNYHIPPAELKGLCDVLGGKRGWFSCDPEGWENRHIKLQNVTAIFPSITLASWASIFTGVQSGKTGILGNEFFDRSSTPPRMITFSDGAFKMMSIFDRYPKPNLNSTPGIGAADLTLSSGVKTVYESIKEIKPDLESVVVMNNYSRGANKWLYQESLIDKLRLAWNAFHWGSLIQPDEADIAKLLDSSPADDTVSYINGLVTAKKKFPSLLSVYFAGLDHWAHDFGMGTYVQFFKDNTDQGMKKVVDALKATDEFDNKIFIVTADHGFTAMPTDLTYHVTKKLIDPDGFEYIHDETLPADTSCKLNLDFSEPQFSDMIADAKKAERENNNLHIWEFGEVMRKLQEKMDYGLWTKDGGQTKEFLTILAPSELTASFKNTTAVTADNSKSNVIAALNGPMAHIYVKGNNGWNSLPDYSNVKNLAEVFRLFMQVNDYQEAEAMFDLALEDYHEIRASVPRLKASIDAILVRQDNEYKVYTVAKIGTSYNVKLLSLGDYFNTAYVDAVNRVTGMNHKDRSGDIVLLMKDEVDIPITEIGNQRFTTGVSCKSWHGSLNHSDSYVPLIVGYPGGNKFEIEKILQKDTVCKTDYSNCKGNWNLTDIVREIVSGQYK